MKNVILSIYSVIAIILLTGCGAGKQTINVRSSGAGKVEIPDSENAVIAINPNESVKITLDNSDYYGYLILNDAQSGLKIPMGLDYHARKTSYNTTATATVGGGLLLMAAAPLIPIEEVFLATEAVGLGSLITGVVMLGQKRSDVLSYKYSYLYDKYQNLKIGDLSNKLLREDPSKEELTREPQSTGSKRGRAQSGASTNVESSPAKRSRNDLAQNVAGTYKGTGKLMKGKVVEEQYADVKLLIEPIDKTSVNVTVFENGEEFFESSLIYDVAANGKTGYKLTLRGMSDATITITKAGVASYTHKKVNIDNEIYTLVLSVKKQK